MARRLRFGESFVTFACRALLVLLPAMAHGQIVRGRVLDARTQSPVPGAVVSLDDATAAAGDASARRASLVLAVLTNERGEYAVQAGFAGRFILSAKRVGLKRYESAPFTLSVGESKRIDITLEAIDFTAALPTISIVTDAPCAVRPAERERVAALWDEARAALTASRLALRDRLFTANMVRYTRHLSTPGLRVLREENATRRGVTERPFYSVSSESLSRSGYMSTDADGANTFYAPDAEVLTSSEFLADHCFAVAADARERQGMVGLSFEPVRTRTVPEIRGSFWIDSATHELRLVEFRYTNINHSVPLGDPRGEVRFAMTPAGAWYVSRWFIRMPEIGRGASTGVPGGSRLEVLRYKEDGGHVTPDGVRTLAAAASLSGRAMDSTGRPFRGATVRILGTQHSTTTRNDGSFRLDSLRGGSFTLLLEHPDYQQLGLYASEQDLEIEEGRNSFTALSALSSDQVVRRLCGQPSFGEDRAAVRVLVMADSITPRADVAVRVRFSRYEAAPARGQPPREVPTTDELKSNAQGAAMFCDLPARMPVRIEFSDPQMRLLPVEPLTLRPGTITVVRLNVPR